MESDYIFSFHTRQRQRFRSGELVEHWRRRYPELFDADDERVLRSEHQRQYHFFEWLGAILLYEAMGYQSFVEKYTAKSHPAKLERLQEIIPPELFSWLRANEAGQPDLFAYDSASGEWFFCEVKGAGDQIRPNQIEWKARLEETLRHYGIPTTRKYRVLCLREDK